MSSASEARIAMMMAMDKNRLIGKEGGMPWHVPGDMAYFKRVTMGKPLIMGRKTFDSLGKPLPGRTNIVVTRNRHWSAEGVVVVHDLETAFDTARDICGSKEKPADEIMVIGGAGLCRDAMSQTERLYLTVIDHSFDGDTWLESFHWEDWEIKSEEQQDIDSTGGLPVTYWVLEKQPN